MIYVLRIEDTFEEFTVLLARPNAENLIDKGKGFVEKKIETNEVE